MNEIDAPIEQKIMLVVGLWLFVLLLNALTSRQKSQETRTATKNVSEGNYTPEQKKLSNANYGAYIQLSNTYYN